MANRKSDNNTVNVMAEQLSDKIKTVTAVDATTEAMVGNMNFGDILIVKNSQCTPDHFGSVASATNTITAIGRFYNTPMYFCQEIK